MKHPTKYKRIMYKGIALLLTALTFMSIFSTNAFAVYIPNAPFFANESNTFITVNDDGSVTVDYYNLSEIPDPDGSGKITYKVTQDFPAGFFGIEDLLALGYKPSSDADSYTSTVTAEKMANQIIKLSKNYDNYTDTTGVRNQIYWMRSLLNAGNSAYLSRLSFGDTLLISLLNHEEILSEKFKNPSSNGNINRIIAGQIYNNAEGYTDIESIAKATGLSVEKVSNIINGIAKGTITEETIKRGKTNSGRTNRGPYLRARAMEHEQVYNYLISEVERMTNDESSLAVLYNDFGGGYIKDILSGEPLDSYKVKLYREHLANVLDENEFSTISDFYITDSITGSDTYKVSKKVQSTISKIYKHELSTLSDKLNETLPEELKNFLDKSLENGILSEEEAREYLILSGEFKPGEHGIGDATKQLVNGYKHLKGFQKALDISGKAFDVMENLKKAEDFIEYYSDNYARQELILNNMVEALSERGGNPELMAAAKQLKSEYENKVYGTFDKIYEELIDKGIDSVKSTFPPLGIAEACISLTGMLTGASDKVDAIETCLAMQGICRDAITSYEEAVIAINNGDESEEAVNQALTTFSIAKTSLQHYYEAVINLVDSEEEKIIYAEELSKLEKAKFGELSKSPLHGGGGGGSR